MLVTRLVAVTPRAMISGPVGHYNRRCRRRTGESRRRRADADREHDQQQKHSTKVRRTHGCQ